MSEFADVTDNEELNDGTKSLLVERPAQRKPNVPKISASLILTGTNHEAHTFSNSHERQDSFMSRFDDLFMDSSRAEHSRTVCKTIAELAAGKLKGQRHCFVGLGARGIGKSQFFVALGDWFAHIGDKNCAFLHQQMGVSDAASPFKSSTTNVRKIVYRLAMELEWDNVPSEPWITTTKCLDWLLSNRKRVFLVLDEFDQCYRVRNSAGLISDLAEIGGDARERPLVVVLLGSSSHLRNLCYLQGNHKEMKDAGFVGVANASNLNSTKFLPLRFCPISTVQSTRRVLECLGITAPEGFDFAQLCKTARGEVRAFPSIYDGMIESTPVVPGPQWYRAFHESKIKRVMRVLWHSVQGAIQNGSVSLHTLSALMNIDVEFTPQLQQQLCCPNEAVLAAGVTAGQLFQCADESVIAFDGGDVSFLHPADIECCVSMFGNEPRTEGRLTLAEEISLLNPNNASADEVNERLVCESLCEKGIIVEGLGRLTFASGSPSAPVFCHGVVRRGGTKLSVDPMDEERSRREMLNDAVVGQHVLGAGESHTAAHLCKEYPDELGGDLIAVFRVQGVESLRYIVVRVQIKLGVSSTTNADRDERTPICKMMENEHFFVQALGVEQDQVDFVRVLWSSQRTKATTDVAQHIILINSADMMNYWIDPVKAFVRERRLRTYRTYYNP